MLFYKTQEEYRKDREKHENPHYRLQELAERLRRLNNRSVIRSQNSISAEKMWDSFNHLER